MTRPKPRQPKKSNFANTDAFTQVEQPKEKPDRNTPAARASDGARKWRNKVAFYIDEDDANRARAALSETSTPSREGTRSFSAMIGEALMKEVARLERKYNSGEQWPPLPAWQMPQGRTRGAATRNK